MLGGWLLLTLVSYDGSDKTELLWSAEDPGFKVHLFFI